MLNMKADIRPFLVGHQTTCSARNRKYSSVRLTSNLSSAMINNFSHVISGFSTTPVYFYTERYQISEHVNTAQRSQSVVGVASLHHS